MAGVTVGARLSAAATDLRTWLAGADPGLARLRLAWIAVASMALAVGLTEVLRATVAVGEPVTVLLFAGVLAMISNLAVNENDLARRRVTTALMVLPAAASVIAGTLLAPYRIPAAAVFVLIMVVAVWVRRYGPRGFALGMAGFMPYFFTQFLAAKPEQLPWLLVAAVMGIGSTLVLRGVVFAERPERTLRRVVTAFRARAHALLADVDDILEALATPDGVSEGDLEAMRRSRARLNETALMVEDNLEQTTAGRVWPGLSDDTLALRVADAELALERLSVAVRRLVRPPEGAQDDQRPDPTALTALRAGLRQMLLATEAGRRTREILVATADARGAVAGLVADTRPGRARVQRTAFAVHRVADTVHHAQLDAPARTDPAVRPLPTGPDGVDPGPDDMARGPASASTAPPPGLALSTRQAVQVGVATTLAIVVSEAIAPQRYYWAVIAAFVVFAGTHSRGDLLGRGWGRVAGTAAGVAAGMGMAALVGGNQTLSLILLAICVFLALYLVRLSPAMLAFWITAVLALVYGLIGQFSVQLLLLRIEETAIGAGAAVLAAFLVLPRGTRAAFGDAVEALVDAIDDVLADAVDRFGGRTPEGRTRDRVRVMDDALSVLRQRARPLISPLTSRRGRSSHQRGLRVMVVCDHYARSLARAADGVTDPSWSATLDPAAARVRANLDALRDVLVRGRRRSDGAQVRARSAERLVDAAEEHVARTEDPHRRLALLGAVRMLRRIDQSVVGLAVDLGAADDTERDETDQSPSTAARPGVANTRSGS